MPTRPMIVPSRSPRVLAWAILALTIAATALVMVQAAPAPVAPASASGLRAMYDSVVVEKALAALPDTGVSPAIVVASRPDGVALTSDDLSGLGTSLRIWALTMAEQTGSPSGPGKVPATGLNTTPAVTGPPAWRTSLSGEVAIAVVPIPTPREGTAALDATASAERSVRLIAALRQGVNADHPAGIRVQVTGPLAIQADLASVFKGADVTLLLVTVAVVGVLLLITYRSPVLWLVPLGVVAAAEQTGLFVRLQGGRPVAFPEEFKLQFEELKKNLPISLNGDQR